LIKKEIHYHIEYSNDITQKGADMVVAKVSTSLASSASDIITNASCHRFYGIIKTSSFSIGS
jgi:hypothetical protein